MLSFTCFDGAWVFFYIHNKPYLHVMSFDAQGRLLGWRAVIIHPDASVSVMAWRGVPPPEGTVYDGASQTVLDGVTSAPDD